ncbi:hypothetical protein BT69DRAFT_1285187, partial [Atractiella rhizophila]
LMNIDGLWICETSTYNEPCKTTYSSTIHLFLISASDKFSSVSVTASITSQAVSLSSWVLSIVPPVPLSPQILPSPPLTLGYPVADPHPPPICVDASALIKSDSSA